MCSRFRTCLRCYLLAIVFLFLFYRSDAGTDQSALNRANQCFRFSRLKEADALFSEIIRMSIQKKDSATIVAALNKRAELALLNGDFITAKEQLDACRSWISKSDQEINPLYADYHATMGDYYMNLSDANIALKHYRKVFAIRTVLDGQRSFNTALSLSRLARYHNFMMNIDSALYYAEKAWGSWKRIRWTVGFILSTRSWKHMLMLLK